MALACGIILVLVFTCFQAYPASAASPEDSYYAHLILDWSREAHSVHFGLNLSVGSSLQPLYYELVWIQLYYKESQDASSQLIWDEKVNWTVEARDNVWAKTYSFTGYSQGVHEVALSLSWADNYNLTNWCNLDGTPMAPYSVYQAGVWSHHIEWTRRFDFTDLPPPPPDLTVLGIGTLAFFGLLFLGGLLSLRSHSNGYHQNLKQQRKRTR
jgi:hypothetical protein